jgi:hypothetical protein
MNARNAIIRGFSMRRDTRNFKRIVDTRVNSYMKFGAIYRVNVLNSQTTLNVVCVKNGYNNKKIK